jgi:hypothetical protein
MTSAKTTAALSGDEGPPTPGRLYWFCQIAGWGSFLAYVLVAYLVTDHPRHASDIVSIVFFNGVVGPALTHALRYWMRTHGWLELSLSSLWLRLVPLIAVMAALITVGVAAGMKLTTGETLPTAGAAGVFAGFSWAFTGWLTIYYVVHARRRREAQQWAMTVAMREAQLRSLRAQLNPHFLFNCLNSLRHLITTNPDRAASMVTGLADLLRYSLESDRTDLVPLADELQIVDEYLALERVRFEERLQVERAVDASVLAVRIPPMLIQALVDNAIKHGIADLPRGGVVRIEAHRQGDRLELLVTNTGRLRPRSGDTGQGLRNARERLRLLFGDSASLTLDEIGETTRAKVLIPILAGAPHQRL